MVYVYFVPLSKRELGEQNMMGHGSHKSNAVYQMLPSS